MDKKLFDAYDRQKNMNLLQQPIKVGQPAKKGVKESKPQSYEPKNFKIELKRSF